MNQTGCNPSPIDVRKTAELRACSDRLGEQLSSIRTDLWNAEQELLGSCSALQKDAPSATTEDVGVLDSIIQQLDRCINLAVEIQVSATILKNL